MHYNYTWSEDDDDEAVDVAMREVYDYYRHWII